MAKLVDEMTDLEFVDHWIDNSTFINPTLFAELRRRGLYGITNFLSGDRDHQKATARARMAKTGRYIGDPELEEISGHIDRIKSISVQIFNMDPTNAVSMSKLADDLKYHSEFVKNYLKPAIIPS